MNTIFKIISGLFLFGILVSCQGPWDYWPEKKEVYKGVYVFGHVIADYPVENVCFQRVLNLDENRSDNFSYYDSAQVNIQGRFSGKDTTIKLIANPSKPACFNGPLDMIPERGENYELDTYLWWDSSGVSVKSHYQAVAKIPARFSIQKVVAKKTLKSSFEEVPEGSIRTYWDYPYDLGIYYAVTDYSADVRGLATYIRYENKTGGESVNNTFNHMLSAFLESDDYIMNYDYADSVYFVDFTENFNLGGINLLDSIGLMNVLFPIGSIEIHAYATDQAYVDYQYTILDGLEDPRVIQVSNVIGGNGYFSGFAADTFRFEMNVKNETDFRSYLEKFVKDCRDTSWSTYSCRYYLDEICADSSYVMKECSVPAIKNALQQAKAWDALLPKEMPEETKKSFYDEGLMRYCIETNFQSFDGNDCEPYRTACITDESKNACKEALWLWCADSDWPILSASPCGSALVSRYRLEKLNSSVLQKVISEWCAISSDPQCKY